MFFSSVSFHSIKGINIQSVTTLEPEPRLVLTFFCTRKAK